MFKYASVCSHALPLLHFCVHTRNRGKEESRACLCPSAALPHAALMWTWQPRILTLHKTPPSSLGCSSSAFSPCPRLHPTPSTPPCSPILNTSKISQHMFIPPVLFLFLTYILHDKIPPNQDYVFEVISFMTIIMTINIY